MQVCKWAQAQLNTHRWQLRICIEVIEGQRGSIHPCRSVQGLHVTFTLYTGFLLAPFSNDSLQQLVEQPLRLDICCRAQQLPFPLHQDCTQVLWHASLMQAFVFHVFLLLDRLSVTASKWQKRCCWLRWGTGVMSTDQCCPSAQQSERSLVCERWPLMHRCFSVCEMKVSYVLNCDTGMYINLLYVFIIYVIQYNITLHHCASYHMKSPHLLTNFTADNWRHGNIPRIYPNRAKNTSSCTIWEVTRNVVRYSAKVLHVG